MKGKKDILVLISGLLFSQFSEAQCAMCRAAIESNGSNAVAEGINNGIVYLMAIPYILVGALLFLIYRKMKT